MENSTLEKKDVLMDDGTFQSSELSWQKVDTSNQHQYSGVQLANKDNLAEVWMMPVENIHISTKIFDSISQISICQTYVNAGHPKDQDFEKYEKGSPIEVEYNFPKLINSVINSLKISIGDDREIIAEVMEVKKSEEKYGDAIVRGHGAAMLKTKKENKDMYTLLIGNIMPGQRAKVEIVIVQPLEIVGGSYNFSVPLSYFPIKSSQSIEKSDTKYQIEFLLESVNEFTDVSHPKYFQVNQINKKKIEIKPLQSLEEISRESSVEIYFRTQNMGDPRLLYQQCQTSNLNGYVALMAQFLPTFESKDKPESEEQKLKINNDQSQIEEPLIDENIEQYIQESKYKNIFLVDRSGSMCGIKMGVTAQALHLFIQSLPSQSQFQIISFGSSFQWMGDKKMQQQMYDYNDENKTFAKKEIDNFMANFGGTEIYQPLEDIFKLNFSNKRIFLLTDGEVEHPKRVIDLIREKCATSGDRVFSFGVGDDCDKNLIRQSAEAGKGSCYFASDSNLSELRSKVIDALQKSNEPQMEECSLVLSQKKDQQDSQEFSIDKENQIFKNIKYNFESINRNQLVQCFSIMKWEDFNNNNFICKFDCKKDPQSQGSQKILVFNRDNFKNLDDEQKGDQQLNIQKLAIKSQIDYVLRNQEKYKNIENIDEKTVEMAIKHQVQLDKGTALFGIIKKKSKKGEYSEMIKIEIKTQNQNNFDDSDDPEYYNQFSSQQECYRSNSPIPQDLFDAIFGMSKQQQQQSFMPLHFQQMKSSNQINYNENCDSDEENCDLNEEAFQSMGQYNNECEEEMHEDEKLQSIEMNEMQMEQEYIEKEKKSVAPIKIEKLNDKQLYEKIINSSSSEGFWKQDSKLFLSQALSEGSLKVLESLLADIKNDQALNNNLKSDMQNYILTVLALRILEKQYQKEVSEWKLIKQKAAKWCKKTNDSIINANLIDDRYQKIEDTIKNLI